MNVRSEPVLPITQQIEKPAINQLMTGWDASLKLMFDSRSNKTILARRQHHGPLVIQKILYPEGNNPAHGVIIHPPGGVAGGDRLQLTVDMQTESSALLTTPGATKWYKSAGRQASQHIEMTLDDNTQLEWLPQENIVFDGADVALKTQVNLAENAVFAGWEVVCLGRQASGERWNKGNFRQQLSIKRDGKLIWNESVVLKPDSAVLRSIAGLRNHVVFGNFVVTAGNTPTEILHACQQISVESSASFGVSALPEIFTARYIGPCAQEAKIYFEKLWHCLRPWYASRDVVRPRIWAT
ncbi:urease accessory protein UreD [Methylophaga sp.]|uniref:urease accessory protein UreD n=1 Tax=Methylophaga sp. TaxID=2024840 RepID=UPI00271B2D83|nr:urease accessory protein UreD [Methylophaga sp.]MDO8825928.1 urease accessory protein UreD [Methylophaga sp.]